MSQHLKSAHKLKLVVDSKSLEKRTSDVLNTTEKVDKGTLARRIALWVCEDLLPFNLVSGSGFKKWMTRNGYVNDIREIPSNVTISQSALDDCYAIVMGAFTKKMLLAPSVIVIVVDMWTSLGKHPFLTLSVRFLDRTMKLVNVVVSTEMLDHPHTGETIARAIEENLINAGLQDRLVIAVGDNGRNIVRIGPHSTRLGSMAGCLDKCKQYCRCLGHNIHLCFNQDMIKDTRFAPALNIIAKIKRIHGVLAYKSNELKAEYQRQQLKDLEDYLIEMDDQAQNLLDDETYDVFDEDPTTRAQESYAQCVSSFDGFSRFEQYNVTRWKSAESVTISFIKNFSKF